MKTEQLLYFIFLKISLSIEQRQVHRYRDLLSLTLYILLAGIMVGKRKMRDRYIKIQE